MLHVNTQMTPSSVESSKDSSLFDGKITKFLRYLQQLLTISVGVCITKFLVLYATVRRRWFN